MGSYRYLTLGTIPQKEFCGNEQGFVAGLILKTRPCNIQIFLSVVKLENFQLKNFDIFAQNIDRGYTLEPSNSSLVLLY